MIDCDHCGHSMDFLDRRQCFDTGGDYCHWCMRDLGRSLDAFFALLRLMCGQCQGRCKYMNSPHPYRYFGAF